MVVRWGVSDFMGNVLVSLDVEREKALRTIAREEFGGKKGAISAVVASAIDELLKKKKKTRAVRHQLELMRKGFNMGLSEKAAFKKRGEVYD